MNITLLVSGAMVALIAAMLACDGKPRPRQGSIFRAEFIWKAYEPGPMDDFKTAALAGKLPVAPSESCDTVAA